MLGNQGLFGLSIWLDWQGDALRERVSELLPESSSRFEAMAEWLDTKRCLRCESYCMTSMVERLMEPVEQSCISMFVIHYDCQQISSDMANAVRMPEPYDDLQDVFLILAGCGLPDGFFDLSGFKKKRAFVEIIRQGAMNADEGLSEIAASILKACDEVEQAGYANEWVWVSAISPSGLKADLRISQDIDALRAYVDVYDEQGQVILTQLIVHDEPDIFPTRPFRGIDWVGDEEVRVLLSTPEYEWDSAMSWIAVPVSNRQ